MSIHTHSSAGRRESGDGRDLQPDSRHDSQPLRRRGVKAALLCALLGAALFLGVGGIHATPAHAAPQSTPTTSSADNGTGGPTTP